MTVDRDHDDAPGGRLPTVVFRPWPPRAAPPFLTRCPIRPRFVRPAVPAPTPDAGPIWADQPPRFARFVAALQSAGAAPGPEPADWDAERWHDIETRVSARPPPDPPASAPAAGLGGRAARAALERARERLTTRRSAVLISAAGATALALVALVEPTGDRDRGRLVGPPAEAGGLVVQALPGPVKQRPQASPAQPSPRLAVKPPPTAPVEIVSVAFEPPEPPSAAPAPAILTGLSAVALPAPPRVEATVGGLAARGKFAALAVRTGTLTRPETEDIDPLHELGRRLQAKGEIAQAIEAYRMAVAARPGHAETYYDWGYLLQQQGDAAGARQQYLMTLRLAPGHPFAHYNLGYLLQKDGDYRDAIKHYQAAIATKPDFFWAHYNLGYLEQKLGDYRRALADYRRSIEIDPKQAIAYENIATILRYHQND